MHRTQGRGYRRPSKLIGVRKPLQNRILTSGAEIFNQAAKDRLEQRICVHHVQIERHELAIQMQLRFVVKRIAIVVLQTLSQRPGDDVAQRVEIKMQVERDAVVQSNAFVVNLVVADETKAECDDIAQLSPNKEARSIRHPLSYCAKIIRGQGFEL